MNIFYTLRESIFFFIFSFLTINAFSQVGIGTTNPNSNALLEIDASTTPGGLLLPRVALVATNEVAPLSAHTRGMAVYNTATTTGANGVSPGYYFNDGSRWVRIAATSDASDDWKLTGNAGTVPDNNFIGTLDATNLRFRTSNAEAFEISSGDATNRGKLRAMTDGTAALPVYSWSSDTDTGIYRVGANSLGFSTNGSEKFRIPNAEQVHARGNGTAAAPFYSWSSDSDLGMYRIGNNTLGFSTNGSERMRIIPNGDTGIGTNSPLAKLHSALNNNNRPALFSEININNSDWVVGEFYNPNTFNGAGILGTGSVGVWGQTTDIFGGWAGFLDGDVYVGWNLLVENETDTWDLTVWNNISTPSDRRIKTNIQDIDNALSLVNRLKPSVYQKNSNLIERNTTKKNGNETLSYRTYNNLKRLNKEREIKKEFGLIAQDLELVIPDLVIEKDVIIKGLGETKLKTVNYIGLMPFLTKAIQEQQSIIESQVARISKLEALVQQLINK